MAASLKAPMYVPAGGQAPSFSSSLRDGVVGTMSVRFGMRLPLVYPPRRPGVPRRKLFYFWLCGRVRQFVHRTPPSRPRVTSSHPSAKPFRPCHAEKNANEVVNGSRAGRGPRPHHSSQPQEADATKKAAPRRSPGRDSVGVHNAKAKPKLLRASCRWSKTHVEPSHSGGRGFKERNSLTSRASEQNLGYCERAGGGAKAHVE